MSGGSHKAQRKCLGCREVFVQDDLVRYVLSPEGELLVDYRQKLPGRGAYTCFDRGCISKAVSSKQFSRAFKGAGNAPEEDSLIASLALQVDRHIMGLIGIARKSGIIISGSNAVIASLGTSETFAFVMVAEDISENIADKVKNKAKAFEVPCFTYSVKEELGQKLGKSERSALGFQTGSLAESLKGELIRYMQIAGEN